MFAPICLYFVDKYTRVLIGCLYVYLGSLSSQIVKNKSEKGGSNDFQVNQILVPLMNGNILKGNVNFKV